MEKMIGGLLGDKGKAGTLAKNLVGQLAGGGLKDLINKFDKKKTDSWVSSGQNDKLSSQEVEAALSPSELEDLARKADMSPSEASEQLATVIPEAIDQLTPGGQIPSESQLQEITKGIIAEEPVAAPAPEAATEPAAEETYTVTQGDTLSAIAQRLYGDASAYTRIFEANRDKLNDPNMIQPGQELRIPR